MPVRILIADDHQVVRDGLRSLLDANRQWQVIGTASNGREATKMAQQLNPEVVLIDIAMPDMNGVDATRKICADNPQTKVIALSMHSDRSYVSSMLRAGASAYIRKESAFEEISEAIDSVIGGKVYLGDGIASVVVEDYKTLIEDHPGKGDVPLSNREREVLQLLAEGHKTAAIAEMLHISVKTIETHRRQIMAKLNLDSIAALTKYAIRHGLTSIEE